MTKRPEDRVADRIERLNARASRAFERALRGTKTAPVRASRGPSLTDSFDAAAEKLKRATAEIRASDRVEPNVPPRERVSAAREHLEELERHVVELAGRRDRETANAAEWERRAMKAVHAGNDDVAREALRRQKEHLARQRTFTREHETTSKVVATLRELLDTIAAAEKR